MMNEALSVRLESEVGAGERKKTSNTKVRMRQTSFNDSSEMIVDLEPDV